MTRYRPIAVATAAMACLAAGCTSAPPPAAAQAEGPVRCRDVRPLGTNVIETLCLTEAGWDEYEESRRRRAQEFLRNANEVSGRVTW